MTKCARIKSIQFDFQDLNNFREEGIYKTFNANYIDDDNLQENITLSYISSSDSKSGLGMLKLYDNNSHTGLLFRGVRLEDENSFYSCENGNECSLSFIESQEGRGIDMSIELGIWI